MEAVLVKYKKGIPIVPKGYRKLEDHEICKEGDFYPRIPREERWGVDWQAASVFMIGDRKDACLHGAKGFIIIRKVGMFIEVEGVEIPLTSEQITEIKTKTFKKGDLLVNTKPFGYLKDAVCFYLAQCDGIVDQMSEGVRKATDEESALYKKIYP